MRRRSKWLDYAVYPPDFEKRGFCWTFRRVTKARSKAKSLGAGSWIRRYTNESETGFTIDRIWLWNGTRFVRISEEPPFYRIPQLDELKVTLAKLASLRDQRSQTNSR
jgi:hypothetical protein